MNNLIELSELRIGNILSYKGELHYVSMLSLDIDDEYQEIIGVTPLGKRAGEKSDWNRALVNDLKRVVASEEWLLKAGFEKSAISTIMPDDNSLIKHGFLFENDGVYITLFKGVFEYSTKAYDGGASWDWQFETTIEYVHEVQNLFHALKRKDLIIK